MTAPAPAREPASRSLTVSPTTATAARVVDAQAGHGTEDEVGRRAPPADVRRGERQVDLGAPTEGVEHRITGQRREPRREAHRDGRRRVGRAAPGRAPGISVTTPVATIAS